MNSLLVLVYEMYSNADVNDVIPRPISMLIPNLKWHFKPVAFVDVCFSDFGAWFIEWIQNIKEYFCIYFIFHNSDMFLSLWMFPF